MSERRGSRDASEAKVEHAIRMARLAGIEAIGSLELGADGTIRITAAGDTGAQSAAPSVHDEIARWRETRGR